MAWVLPEVVMQRLLTIGIKDLRKNPDAFYELFSQYYEDEMIAEYGENYVDQIWTWFSTTKIPVIKAWSFNAQKIPCISVHLASETEDESKAAINDYAGNFNDVDETGTAVMTVNIDIGLHANKAGDHVLWMYYIVSYILFKNKLMAERMGLKLHTFTASDYRRDANIKEENIWTRWLRFRATTQNFWGGDAFSEVEAINVDPAVDLPPSSDIATSLDVDESTVDRTANKGIYVSRVPDVDGDEDLGI